MSVLLQQVGLAIAVKLAIARYSTCFAAQAMIAGSAGSSKPSTWLANSAAVNAAFPSTILHNITPYIHTGTE